MKRVLAIVLTMCMTIGVSMVGVPVKEVEEPVIEESAEVIETKEIDYLTDTELSLLYECKEEKPYKEIVDLTTSEAQLLMMVTRAEGGDSLDGQLWTMRTLLNRVDSDEPDFKKVNTIGEVIFQDGQFEVVSKGTYKKADVNVNTHLALAMIEGGWDETNGALWFEASSNSTSSWHSRNLTFIKEVEGQRYYK